MSNAAITWARKVRGYSAGAKLVLMLLADSANGSHECWISQQMIADDSGLTRQTVNELIKALAKGGALAIIGTRQQQRYRLSVVSADTQPDDAQCQESRHSVSDIPTLSVGSADTNPKEPKRTQSSPPSPPRKRRGGIEVEGFGEWYAAYPRHEARADAARAYAAALKATDAGTLLVACRRYAELRAADDPKFTKLPATWLNKQCWLDEPATGPPTVAARKFSPITNTYEAAYHAAEAVNRRHGFTDDRQPDFPAAVPLLDGRRASGGTTGTA